MGSPHRAYTDLYRALSADVTTLVDPGDGGTVNIREGTAFGIVTLATAGTISLPTAADNPVGTQILVLAQAAVTVEGTTFADGEYGLYMITTDSSGDNEWTLISSTFTGGNVFDADGVADAFVLDADGDTTLSSPTDDQVDVEVAGTDIATLTSTGITLIAGVAYRGQGSTIAGVMPAAAAEDIAAGTGGAISIATYYTTFDTDAGGDAFTLADGAQVGQLKKIQMITDGGGDGTLTPSNLSGGTTITFADAGDFAVLMWDGTNWVAIELGNAADGVTAPVLA